MFDLWHYDDPLVTFETFFVQGPQTISCPQGENGTAWRLEVLRLRYRMWQRREMADLMATSGLTGVQEIECSREVRLGGYKTG
jgi:hypothetical protein